MPGDQLRITGVGLEAQQGALPALARFYGVELGLACEHHGDRVVLRVGDADLGFTASADDARPFYHFALLVPGDRFDAAHAWITERTRLWTADGDDTVFAFDSWNALACYFTDPAGNIVELIAHRGIAERASAGRFSPAELAGISEIGIVTLDLASAASLLERELGLVVWCGGVGERAALAFVGRQAHTLILSGEGRGWLPTGRPAERHPVSVTLSGGEDREVCLAPHPRLLVRRSSAGPRV